jgi:hypothetical protein
MKFCGGRRQMAKYIVTGYQHKRFETIVEAENEEEAIYKAEELDTIYHNHNSFFWTEDYDYRYFEISGAREEDEPDCSDHPF